MSFSTAYLLLNTDCCSCENTGPIHLALVGFMADWQAGRQKMSGFQNF